MMVREFKCPSCGAGNRVTNPGILMKVCDYCKTAIYWDKDAALRAGKKSMDLPPSKRFRLGGTGKLGGEKFTVVGRLAYSHGKGAWSEWFIETETGTIRWLSEDEGELFLEDKVTLSSEVPPFEKLQPGMQIVVDDRPAIIEELGEAECIGGEGQIPFEVEIGEVYPYADGTAADGSFVFGLEYDTDTGIPTAFKGKALSTGAAKAAPGVREEPTAERGEVIRCASCGAPYEGKIVETTEMIVCDACGAALELDEAETRVVGRNEGERPPFALEIGTPVTLEGATYEVMGRLHYVEVEEGITYNSHEYALYHPEKGYLWLSEELNHFTISRPVHMRVSVPDVSPRRRVQVGSETFRVYEGGTVTLNWVDGALPWTASVGERTQYVHMIKPPDYVDQEITGRELELFRGRYVDREEIEAAVPGGTQLHSPPRTVYSCQPFRPAGWMKGLGLIGGVFLALNVLLVVYSAMMEDGSTVLKEKLAWEQYSKEYLSQPFEVDRSGALFRLKGHAPLKNSWVALSLGLVNSNAEVVTEFWDEASFYSGRDSEGYWTEGSKSFTTYFKVADPGTYRLLVYAEGGSGTRGSAKKEPITIVLERDVTIAYYFILPLILSAVAIAVRSIAKYSFEARRWATVLED